MLKALFFLYFLFVSSELLNVKLLIFRVKLSLFFALIAFIVFFFSKRVFSFDRDFLYVALGCFGSLLISAICSENVLACCGFLGLFIINYILFFVFPMNLFAVFDWREIYRLYFLSFTVVGIFASAQVLCSAFEVYLPFTTQRIGSFARGQGLCYEPSYYALYMTPFAVYHTVRFLLERRGKIVGPNLLYLVSTSASCFLAYLTLFLSFLAFRCKQKMRRLMKFSFWILLISCSLWLIQPPLITHGLFKYAAAEFMVNTFLSRWTGIVQFWGTFLDHPILGAGLGGATTHYAKKEGLEIALFDSDILDLNSAMNVTTEILGSLGLVGICAFSCFLFVLYHRCCSALKAPMMEDERIHGLSLIISLCVLFAVLQFNQSIMRSYVWLHVGLSMGYLKSLNQRCFNSFTIFRSSSARLL